MAFLSTRKVNLGLVREVARKDLVNALEKCPGPKAIIWDEQLTGPVGLVAEYSFLKDQEVVKMFQIKPGRLPQGISAVKHVIFIARPCVELMDNIAENLHSDEKRSSNKREEYHLLFVPRRSLLCEKRLKERGVFGSLTIIDELPWDFYPLDNDLISMEQPMVFKDLYLNKDPTALHHIAKGLTALQMLYGTIPTICGKGQSARTIYDLMLRLRREIPLSATNQTSPQIDNLILIDRTTDLVSPVATQLTYEGLIDEIFGINQNTVKLPAEKFVTENDTGSDVKQIVLNSAEELYTEIRDKNFSAVGPALSRKAKTISAQYEERHGAKTVGELKQFVAKLPQMQIAKQSLTSHTSIAELIKEVTISEPFLEALQVEQDFLNGIDTDKIHPYIEDCIARKEPLIKVLRLLCLQSSTNSGFKPKILEHYKREILQAYGFQHFVTLQNLEKAGLIKLQQNQRGFTVLRRTLKLIVDDVNEANPTDISYVHSIYAPLSIRLVQYVHRPGWKSLADVLSLLPGPVFHETQPVPVGLRKRRGSGSSIQADEPQTTLVFFIGGCTFAEIGALRFLAKQEEVNMDFIIGTTKVVHGSTLIQSLLEPLRVPLF